MEDSLTKPLNVLTAGITIKNPDVMEDDNYPSKLDKYANDAPLDFIINDEYTANTLGEEQKERL